ncbi:hemin-degrading factor [Shimwellia pseudoproteus]|uniref:hemin-degrading factor n=1 Tax=Shimwellia pseudoproteus TaxID=570012 RepID=UPI0018EB2D56|nr:ChuX/HutX family heme-like substrate-binding protein [Shimwellia pseudoproteus]MBJ3814463.1 hemin-degrading factor [Shimwellia pseudoproteus]
MNQPVNTPLPAKYARDLAAEQGISEAEYTAARQGKDAVRLIGEIPAIIAALEAVGETKCICRNAYAVHEQVGAFTNQHIGSRAGLVLNPRALDLRLFVTQWASIFALHEHTPRGERRSIQFFDNQGDAVLKVYATGQTNLTAWEEVVTRFTAATPPPLSVTPARPVEYAACADSAALESAWRAMTDVHQFFTLLKKHNLSRQQAFRLVPDYLARQVSNDTLPRLLDTVWQDANEIMIFVGNRGCVQIFSGPLEKQVSGEGWLNIFNPQFTLHLRETAIAESWITRKPTIDGHVTSLELFAADGTQIAQLYGQRSEGMPEQAQWRQQIDAVPSAGKTA